MVLAIITRYYRKSSLAMQVETDTLISRRISAKQNYYYFLKDNVEHFCSKGIVSLLQIGQNISRICHSICACYYRRLYLLLPFLVL
jgi:hypothetical protein